MVLFYALFGVNFGLFPGVRRFFFVVCYFCDFTGNITIKNCLFDYAEDKSKRSNDDHACNWKMKISTLIGNVLTAIESISAFEFWTRMISFSFAIYRDCRERFSPCHTPEFQLNLCSHYHCINYYHHMCNNRITYNTIVVHTFESFQLQYTSCILYSICHCYAHNAHVIFQHMPFCHKTN